MRYPGYVILLPLWAVGLIVFMGPIVLFPIVLGLVLLSAVAYFIYYLMYRDAHLEILARIALALLVMLLGLIPIIGWLIIISFVIYNVVRSFQGLLSLLPDAMVSGVIYALLVARVLFDDQAPEGMVPALTGAYALVTFLYANYLRRLPVREALFKLSVMWLSIPLMAIIVATIVSSLSNLIRSITSVVSHPVQLTEHVSGHMRAGIEVSAYTREVVRTASESVTTYVPDVGVMTSAIAPAVAGLVTSDKSATAEKATLAPPRLPSPPH